MFLQVRPAFPSMTRPFTARTVGVMSVTQIAAAPEAAAASAAPTAPTAPGASAAPTAASLNWLRAGVLGANDGIVSIAATVVGVAGATSGVTPIAIAGIAALAAGAWSMAAGEYVSVSSQRDAERVALERGAGVGGVLDRDDGELTNPWHAAVASFASFVVGGLVPLLVVLAPWGGARVAATFVAVLVALVVTGLVSARFSRASSGRAVLRNVVGGSLAMAVTYALGSLVGLAL